MSISISDNGSYLNVGTRSINKARILFFDRDSSNVYIVQSDRLQGHSNDQNTTTIPFDQVTESPGPFESSQELQEALVTLCQE